MSSNKFGRKTSPGFADPTAPVSLERSAAGTRPEGPTAPVPVAPIQFTHAHDDASEPAPRGTQAPAQMSAVPKPEVVHIPSEAEVELDSEDERKARIRHVPLVEVEVVHERGRAPRSEPLRRCYEVWTQNTVYVVDSRMHCIEVRTAAGDQAKEDHPFVGARLVGGQLQNEGSIEMSYPLPRPGSFAVFESRKGNRRHFSRTSSVERVVLRLRIVTVTDGSSVPCWADLVGD